MQLEGEKGSPPPTALVLRLVHPIISSEKLKLNTLGNETIQYLPIISKQMIFLEQTITHTHTKDALFPSMSTTTFKSDCSRSKYTDTVNGLPHGRRRTDYVLLQNCLRSFLYFLKIMYVLFDGVNFSAVFSPSYLLLAFKILLTTSQ